MGAGCVSIWGNDLNAGTVAGSEPTEDEWKNSKRSIQAAKDAALTPIYVKGLFNENVKVTIIGDGDTVLDGIFLGSADLQDVDFCKLINHTNLALIRPFSSIIENCTTANTYVYNFEKCIIKNTHIPQFFGEGGLIESSYHNLTYYNIRFIDSSNANTINKSIINNAGVGIEEDMVGVTDSILYSLFINCAFEFSGGTQAADETSFTYPTGVGDDAKLQNLKDRMAVVYGGNSSSYLTGCKYYSGSYSDIYIDADNGDFNLVPGCIAVNMAYDGSPIGARPIGIKASWNANWNNIINIDSNGRVIDQTIDASADSDILHIGAIRKLVSFNDLGQRAARNGVQINTEANLGAEISAGTSVLTDGEPYEVVNDTITRDDGSATAQVPWDTFTAIDEGSGVGLGFSGSGQCRQVLIDEYDSKSQYKFHQTDETLLTANTITCYNNVSEIKVNVDVNGNPTHGDADVGFNSGAAVDLFFAHMQIIKLVKADQLPAR